VPTCEHCSGHVDPVYARVCGDNEGRVWSCPNCAENAQGTTTAGYEDRQNRQTNSTGGPAAGSGFY